MGFPTKINSQIIVMRPGMSDGRLFTDWNSSCQMNDRIQQEHNISSDAEYRFFLQKNATSVMQKWYAPKSINQLK